MPKSRANFSIGRLKWLYSKGHKHEYGDGPACEVHIPDILARSSSASSYNIAEASLKNHGAVPCLCTTHFDFSLIKPLYKALPVGAVVGLALIREPVSRFLSHFYHAR